MQQAASARSPDRVDIVIMVVRFHSNLSAAFSSGAALPGPAGKTHRETQWRRFIPVCTAAAGDTAPSNLVFGSG